MRAAGYFRVSDEDQIDGYSLDAQRRAFGEFCRQKGWEAVETYCEEGRSAWVESIAKRPAFRQMLEDAHARRFDVLVSHTLDRFSRNLRVMLDAFHTFAQSDVTYVSITQEIDYSKPEGKLFMTMLGAFAQYFSDALSGHTKKGLRERAQQGMFNGEPPFGYQRCDADCFGLNEAHPGCHVEQEKASNVVALFERYAGGTESMSALADWLNEQGFRTKGKRKAEFLGELAEVNGRRFTHWSIRDILKNPFYVGKVRHKDELFDGRHQPIVSQELFDDVQEQMARNRSRKGAASNSNKPNPHLLTGLLRCHECGTVLWSQRQGTQPGTYYKSPDKGLGRPCKHKGRAFLGRDFDAQTDQLFCGFTLRDDWVDWIIENHVREADPHAALQRRRSIEEKIGRARHLYINGDLRACLRSLQYVKLRLLPEGVIMSHSYSSDISREQFARILPYLESARRRTKPRTVDLYDVFCGVLYLLKSGCQWRMLPADFPDWRTCYKYFRQWSERPDPAKYSILEQVLKKIGWHSPAKQWSEKTDQLLYRGLPERQEHRQRREQGL